MSANWSVLEHNLHYQFSDRGYLELALTHRSADGANNERLEFLGDAVLGAVVAEFLYRQFPQADEGDLSRMRAQLVCAESLAGIARRLELGAHLALGAGEMKSGGRRRDSILGDAVEALIGAIYLDAGVEQASRCIALWFQRELERVVVGEPRKDAKTSLQEWLQRRGKPVPNYQLAGTEGEAHQRRFTVSCQIEAVADEFRATASSRRKAEQLVAEKLLAAIEEIS